MDDPRRLCNFGSVSAARCAKSAAESQPDLVHGLVKLGPRRDYDSGSTHRLRRARSPHRRYSGVIHRCDRSGRAYAARCCHRGRTVISARGFSEARDPNRKAWATSWVKVRLSVGTSVTLDESERIPPASSVRIQEKQIASDLD